MHAGPDTDRAMPRILVFQHVAAEPLGTLDPLIRRRGHRIRSTNVERHPDAVFNNVLDLVGRPRRPHTLPSREWV